MARLCVLGDSWACGEWAREKRRGRPRPKLVPDTGFDHYLRQQGHRVTSVAEGGTSNLEQLQRLTQFPRAQHTFDQVIMVLTDPLRDVFADRFDQARPHTWQDYRELYDQAEQDQYRQISQLTVPVLLVGGCVRVNTGLAHELGIPVAQPDWFTDLTGRPRPYCLEIICRAWYHWSCDTSLLEYLEEQHEQERQHIQRTRQWHPEPTREHLYFGIDGVHPNRRAHERLAQQIGSQL